MRESLVVNRWKAEAKAEGQAEAILAVLAEKFGAVPGELANAIGACTDLATLRQWVSAAVRADTLAAFRAAAGV